MFSGGEGGIRSQVARGRLWCTNSRAPATPPPSFWFANQNSVRPSHLLLTVYRQKQKGALRPFVLPKRRGRDSNPRGFLRPATLAVWCFRPAQPPLQIHICVRYFGEHDCIAVWWLGLFGPAQPPLRRRLQ